MFTVYPYSAVTEKSAERRGVYSVACLSGALELHVNR